MAKQKKTRLETLNDTPWLQQPGESSRLYAHAKVYFELGPQRSLQQAAQLEGVSKSLMYRSSSIFRWVERAQAYDRHLEEIRQGVREQALTQHEAEESQLWLRRLRDGRESEWALAQALLARVREMVATPLEEVRWSQQDIARLSDLAARLSRQAAGEALEQHEQGEQSEAGLHVRVEYVAADGP